MFVPTGYKLGVVGDLIDRSKADAESSGGRVIVGLVSACYLSEGVKVTAASLLLGLPGAARESLVPAVGKHAGVPHS